jgi:hypothetical protein
MFATVNQGVIVKFSRLTNKVLSTLSVLVGLSAANSFAGTILYSQNFENPVGFVNDGGDFNIFKPINTLYGGQPAGFNFAQQFTVETLRVGGTQAFGVGYKDPQGRAGSYVVGMLSSVQDDLLGLSFNVGANKFLNFQVDISSIDLDRQGGPFVPAGGLAPTFRFSLYDNPTGIANLGTGTLLSSVDVTGTKNASKFTFDWTNFIVALNATGNTNGNVTIRIDELFGGYAALDNFLIASSDVAGDVTPPPPTTGVPLPSSIALLLLGFSMVPLHRRFVNKKV